MLKKPEKIEEQSVPKNNRIKLPREEGIRPFSGIKELLAMAQNPRGSQVELEWTTKTPGQVFVLDVEWDPGIEDPFWSLYETNDGKSKTIWSQSFAAANIEMFYDILVMSCGAVDPSKKLSDILKSQPIPEKDAAKSSENKTVSSASPETPQTPIGSAPVPGPVANPIPESSPNANPGFVQPYGFPQPAGMPVNPFAMAYNVPPHMQGVPIPMPYPPNINPPAFAVVPAMPNTGMPNAAWPSNVGTGENANLFKQISGDQTNMNLSIQSGREVLSALPIDASLFNKQNDIALIDLLVKAELITETVLAAALKVQDLICSKRLGIEKACKILKRYNSKGGAIENYIDATLSAAVDKSSHKERSTAEKKQEEDKETLNVFELMQKAGLLSSNDIKIAKGVSLKHGGDIVSILKAAQKVDEKTLDAAKICQVLERDGKMKLEQSVILLNYCSRSRVSFDEALNELNWPDPRV